jgi:hypothetical protein
MVFFLVIQVLNRLKTLLSIFARWSSGVIIHRSICGVALLLWSIVSGALAQDIPSGFKIDRYAQVWEHNPFTLMKPSAPKKAPSSFEKLFLASWLNNGGEEVVLVQNSETNEVQRVTPLPNQNNLRLVEMHPNPNPQLVEVVISDGKEQGTVKFRFDVQPSSNQTSPVEGGQGSAQSESATGPGTASQVVPPTPGPTQPMSRLHPGVRKYHTEGQAGPNSIRKLPPRRNRMPNSSAAQPTQQSTPGQN